MRRSADGRPAAALGPISSEGRSACACGRGCDITSYPWRTGLQRDQSGEKNGSVTAICWLSKKKREPVWFPAPQKCVFPRKTQVIRGRNPGYPPLKERERKEKNSKVKERAPPRAREQKHKAGMDAGTWMKEAGRRWDAHIAMGNTGRYAGGHGGAFRLPGTAAGLLSAGGGRRRKGYRGWSRGKPKDQGLGGKEGWIDGYV